MFFSNLKMFLLLLVCLWAGDEEYHEENIVNKFSLYAGNLIYDDNDGRCIACDGSCTRENAVSPRSWFAVLEYLSDGKLLQLDFSYCEKYAKAGIPYGVAAFTWTKSSHNCSLHVLDDFKHNIAEKMKVYNGFDWQQVNRNNTGAIYVAKFPSGIDKESIDSMCYFGLHVKGEVSSVASMADKILITVVILLLVSWNGWMRYTNSYPRRVGVPEHDHESMKADNMIYCGDSSDKDDKGKKDE